MMKTDCDFGMGRVYFAGNHEASVTTIPRDADRSKKTRA
jgi:hypothetical protein